MSQRNLNPQPQQKRGRRPTPQTARPPVSGIPCLLTSLVNFSKTNDGVILKCFPYTTYMVLSISSDYFPRQHYLIGLNDEVDVSSHAVTLKKREDTGNRKRKRQVAVPTDLAVVQAVTLSHDGLPKLQIMEANCIL